MVWHEPFFLHNNESLFLAGHTIAQYRHSHHTSAVSDFFTYQRIIFRQKLFGPHDQGNPGKSATIYN